MDNKIELAKVPVGKPIKAFGKKFTVLEHSADGVLVLSDTIEKEMPFRKEDCEAPNDFRYSDIHSYLNGEYLDELAQNASGEEFNAILTMKMDLKCTLGQHEYGTWNVNVGLLTLEQYGKYFDIIPKADCSWWLATPYGTPLRSAGAYYTGGAWYVGSGGGCGDNVCTDSYGVRPALVLDSSLLVSCDDISDNKATQLSDFSDEDLIAEIKRRLDNLAKEEL